MESMSVEQAIQSLEKLKLNNDHITTITLWHDEDGWTCSIAMHGGYEYRWLMEDSIIDAIRGCIEKFKNGE